MRAARPALRFEGVGKQFGPRHALRDVCLTLAPGQCLAVLGPNGAGKSTLLRIAALLSRPSAGTVRLGDRRIAGAGADPDAAAAWRARIGVAGHETYLYEHLTAAENLRFYARLHGLPGADARASAALAQAGLAEHGGRLVREFSRGMAQRLALARATLHEPDLLVLDEPHTGLDAAARAALDAAVRRALAAGASVMLASHDLEAALALAGTVLVLAGGRVRQLGPPPAPGGADAWYRGILA